MEENKKKKKRNKKNKNKQIKPPEEDLDPNNNNNVTNSHNINITGLDLEVEPDTHRRNGALPSSAEEMVKELQNEKESHVQKEATLQETIQHLQKENESYIHKQRTLEETINQLRNECDSHLRKEASLEESILKLQPINDSHLQKEVSLKETILQLQSGNESHIQKMAASEMDIIRLHNEKESWLQEKAILEAKICQLLEEKAALDLKGNSTKETMSILNRDITRLKMQVVELEESRSKLLQENQQLTNTASSLQLRIQNCERDITSSSPLDEVKKQAFYIKDLNSQIEAASVLVEKLVMENTELVEKVNELSVKLERQTMAARHSTVIEMSDPGHHSIDNGSISAPKLDSLEVTQTNEGKIDGVNEDGQPAQLPLYVESEDSGEIVQIPLDDTDARDSESQAIESNTVTLTDAPLIGAPFRLISFVANYVTGADLVNDTSSSES